LGVIRGEQAFVSRERSLPVKISRPHLLQGWIQWLIERLQQSLCQLCRIPYRNKVAMPTIAQDLGRTAGRIGRDDGLAAGERLDDDVGQAFEARRENEKIGVGDPRQRVWLIAYEVDGFQQIELPKQLEHPAGGSLPGSFRRLHGPVIPPYDLPQKTGLSCQCKGPEEGRIVFLR